jgi:3-deoxy-D-manno-octulosonic-acid transferase
MLSTIYNLAWYPALPFALLVGGGRDSQNRRERLGEIAEPDPARSPRIWVHAASVGEIEAVRPIVGGLARALPRAAIAITTMTVAGREAASRRIGERAACQLAPLDCPLVVRRFIRRLRPQLVLIAETELWPNFFVESARAGARVALINARVSARSISRYRLIRPLIARALAHADLVLAQSEADAARYRELGASPKRVIVTGNTKFDLDSEAAAQPRPALANFVSGRPSLVAGSTAPGEERMVLTAHHHLLERFPTLGLVIAPRHLERISEVEAELHAAGIEYAKASALSENGSSAGANVRVLLLDTMGDLRRLFASAAIAFIGGSIAPPRGGQNLGEPAQAAVPVLFGPHYENQQQVGDALIAAGGGVVVTDAGELETRCAEWLADDQARRAAGLSARRVMEQLAGGTAATLRHLASILTVP